MIHYFWVHTVNAGARFFFLDPYFPISDQRELIGYHGSTFFFQFHMYDTSELKKTLEYEIVGVGTGFPDDASIIFFGSD